MGTATSNKKFSYVGKLIHKISACDLLHPVRGTIIDIRSNSVFSSDDEDGRQCTDFRAGSKYPSRCESMEVRPLEAGAYEKLLLGVHGMEALIAEVFDTTATLKKAYVRLQVAHTSYDPEKLHLADSAVVAELRKISELKESHRKLKALTCSFPRTLNGSFREIGEQKKTFEAYEDVKDLKANVKEKDSEIEFLRRSLRESNIEKEKLERRLKKLEYIDADGVPNWGFFPDSPTPELFNSMMEHVKERSRSFTKVLISLMTVAKWDIHAAAASITPRVVYRKPSDKKYAFESYFCERMFHGFENESFYVSGSLSSLLEPENHRRDCFSQFRHMLRVQPMEILNIKPDCPLGKFCNKKYLRIVHPKMEEAFFGNLEHRSHVENGKHPTSDLYQTFLGFAKAVWVLHKLAFSFSRVPNPFNVNKNAVFLQSYMESVVSVDELNEGVPLVAFAISPGFKLEEDFIVKSTVYVVGKHGENNGDMS